MQPHHLARPNFSNRKSVFSFDFSAFCVTIRSGHTQAAYPSVNGAAPSTPHAKKWILSCRAGQICKASPAKTPLCSIYAPWAWRQLRLQAQLLARATRTANGQGTYRAGRAWRAINPQPALFHAQCLSAPPLCDSSLGKAGQICAASPKGALC